MVDVGRPTVWCSLNFLGAGGFIRELETKPANASSRGLIAWTKFFFRTCPDYLKPHVFYGVYVSLSRRLQHSAESFGEKVDRGGLLQRHS
jgi:hypothetical protein